MLFLNRCHNGSLVITIKRKRNKEGMFDIFLLTRYPPPKERYILHPSANHNPH